MWDKQSRQKDIQWKCLSVSGRFEEEPEASVERFEGAGKNWEIR